jgi:2-oxoglutarate ferredoxin oxidoreductase subunit delta
MPTLQIENQGCRACSLCVDVCPTQVFELEPTQQVAKASRSDDCIGCCSCEYICPSRCLTVVDSERQLPFYRLDQASQLVSRFLQQQPSHAQIQANDVTWAVGDVQTRLRALGESATETMGRGVKVVGRTAGTLAAAHLPDLYEDSSLTSVLEGLSARFAGAFPFTFEVVEGCVSFTFSNCAIQPIVEGGGSQLGTDPLCVLFHEYWSGLIGEYSKKKFAVEPNASQGPCSFRITGR